MSDGPGQPKPPSTTPPAHGGPSGAAPTGGAAPAAGVTLGWKDVWQVPTLLLATTILVGGVIYVLRLPRDHEFGPAMDQVDSLVADSKLDEARAILFDKIGPFLEQATPLERARFDATAADWLAAARTGTNAVENDKQIAERYARAEEGGLELDRERMLRWATALVQLGQTEEALKLISKVAVDTTDTDGLLARVRRMVMEKAWAESTAVERPDYPGLLVALGSFRAIPSLGADDEAWAAARQAEARLKLDRPREAADRLLLDLRRLEAVPATGRPAASSDSYAELSTLLGTAFAQLGEVDLARESLERAVNLSTAKSIPKGNALVLLGQLALQRGDLEEAEQRFESVLADYSGAACYAPALFGRAETRAARGDHLEALEDYRELRTKINTREAKGVTGEEVVGSLLDRHDALLVAGDLERALEYARMASDYIAGRPPRPDILLRMATTGRSLADRMASGPDAQDPETKARAARILKNSADWFLAHANHPDAIRESADGWAESLWLAADSYEKAGWAEEASTAFKQFVEGRPEGDLRRAEAIFRIASILNAEGDLEEAAAQYARVIDEFPASPIAARATVPLAQCLEATDRRADALSRLQAVVDGHAGLKPDAPEYREALLELARLTVSSGDLARGAALLDEALRRYPNDHRVPEMRFQLGECRRGLARDAAKRLADGALSPSQRQAIDEQRQADLDAARGEFEAVVQVLDKKQASDLDPLERDALRLSHLYRADCLFDLGRYREAIDLYEIAERRYADNAVSMVALIQIVNAWHELGDADRAVTAERRAEIRLAQLPDTVFLEGDSIFSREAWERWLKHRPPGPRMAAGENAGAAETEPGTNSPNGKPEQPE